MAKMKQWLALASVLSGVILGFVALFLPPQGVLDPSVLVFTAQLLIFAGTCLGLDVKLDGKK